MPAMGVRLYTMTGADWSKRYPLIVEAAAPYAQRPPPSHPIGCSCYFAQDKKSELLNEYWLALFYQRQADDRRRMGAEIHRATVAEINDVRPATRKRASAGKQTCAVQLGMSALGQKRTSGSRITMPVKCQ
jgi:hypothetical protein